ncbi:MAG TPA: putative metal-dependent hydrolase [Bacteroidota bacterium]|nr:putative metal-dependent hydrolase [Bacteroidota bacterium]
MNEDLRYPIGPFHKPAHVEPAERAEFIRQLASVPEALRAAVNGLDDRQLDTPYRHEGWTVRQVVHHLPDSHINAYVRFKLALTEESPLIRTYEEALWAQVTDARSAPIEMSLALLEALHLRWVAALNTLPKEAFQRVFRHPDLGLMSIDQQLAQYAWHGKHHVAHITSLRRRMRWGTAD